MVWYVAITLYILGAVIAVWGITLLRRAWRGRRGQDGGVAVGVRQPRRVLAGVVGMICVPLGMALVVIGDSARRGFEGWDGIPSRAWGIGAAAVCLTFAVALVYAGLRFDPAAGRRRCPRCWYDMGGTTGMRCPECGGEAKSERRLGRTRRCKRLVAAGLLLGVTPYAVRTAEIAAKDGWRAAVPTTALIVAFPYLPDDMVSNSRWSLAARLESDRISAWQRSFFQRRRGWAMSRATDFRLIWRCVYLRFGGADVKPSAAGVHAIYRAALEGSQDSPNAMMVLQGLNLKPPPGTEEAYARAAIEAMESRTPSRAAAGAIVPMYCGSEGELAVRALLDLALDREADGESRRLAITTLLWTVDQWESSRSEYIRLLREVDAPFRPAAFALRVPVDDPVNSPELREILREEMWSRNRESAAVAAETLVYMTHDPASLVGEAERLVTDRPDLDPTVVTVLAQNPACRNEQFARLLERMLASDSLTAQCAAAKACGHFGPLGRRFLPVLLAFEEGEDGRRRHDARVAIARILQFREPFEEEPGCIYPP